MYLKNFDTFGTEHLLISICVFFTSLNFDGHCHPFHTHSTPNSRPLQT